MTCGVTEVHKQQPVAKDSRWIFGTVVLRKRYRYIGVCNKRKSIYVLYYIFFLVETLMQAHLAPCATSHF